MSVGPAASLEQGARRLLAGRGTSMKAPKPFRFLTPFFVVALAMTAGPSAARGTSRASFGRPLDGLSLDELRQFRDGKEAFAEEEDAADGLGPIFNNTGCAV